MKLVRIKLENWRGVGSCSIEFAKGITLIEGPNEVGKSTLLEALQLIFVELDSSNKKTVKSIQPVGQDVPSRVEVEIVTGNYRFIYAKTYNKDKQTSLRITEPKAEQLTGREAHERAEQIMQSTIDLGFWNALLVEQGLEITGVKLTDSDSLVHALDEAAGGTSHEEGDSDLYARVQSEYEHYYTLKTGKSKFVSVEQELHEAHGMVNQASDALKSIEDDSASYESCAAEIRRLDGALPTLLEKVGEHEEIWNHISLLQQQITAKQKECDAEQQLWQAAVNEHERRKTLIKDLSDSSNNFSEKNEQIEPFAESVKELKAAKDAAASGLKDLKMKQHEARASLDLARADEEYLLALERLENETKRLKSLQDLKIKADDERAKLSDIKIDPSGLETFRKAENALQLAIGKRDTVTSAVEIIAERDLKFFLNEDQLNLAADDIEKQYVTSKLNIRFPGVASIRVTPSQSAADLEADVVEQETKLSILLEKYAVESLADAIAVEGVRADSERNLEEQKRKISDLLGSDSEADVTALINQLKARCDTYLEDRADGHDIPIDIGLASAVKINADEVLECCETDYDSQQQKCDQLREEHSQAEADLRVSKQEVIGLESDVKNKQKQLDEARNNEPDESLDDRVAKMAAKITALRDELESLRSDYESASPEATEALLNNSRAVYQRAKTDLEDSKTKLAILEDRLVNAQANGRFEALNDAERYLDELTIVHESTSTRAAAAKLLWETINKHRDNTRKAYVLPLKQGIEQLGRIVFGSDFAVELNESWALVSRTRDGKTIPFESLSVGAKEQLGILTRLAAARLVSNQGGVPLIIDDALGYSDPARLETMGAAIAATGRESQIILLTCTPGRFTNVGSAEVVRL